MKKVLSIMLATMMVVSLFAINASAAIPATHEVLEGYVPETNLFVQDFSDVENKTDFTERQYEGSVSVSEDGVLHMTGGYRTGVSMSTTSTTPITTGEYTFEFDFMRNDDLTADYWLFVTFQRAANAESTNENLKKYGVVIPVRTTGMVTVEGVNYEDITNPDVDIEPHKWYTYRLTISESAFVAAGGAQEKAQLLKLMTVQRKLKNDTEWTTLNYTTGGNNFNASSCRIYGVGATAWNNTNEVNIGVTRDSYGQQLEVKGYTWDETTQKYVEGTEIISSEDGRNADFQFDNIRVYKPGEPGEMVTKDLPINKGVVFTSLDKTTLEMVGKDVEIKDAEGNVTGTEKQPSTTYGTKVINWTYEPTSFVATFDAMNEVAGGPLSISFAGKEVGSAMCTIRPTEAGKWYSYKLLFIRNGVNESISKVYRKAEDETEWTQLTYTGNKNDAEGNDVWMGYNGSSSYNNIRFYLYAGQTNENRYSNCELGTKWSIRNIQVTDSYAMTGVATVDDGNLTIDLNTVVADAAAMIAAVYDGDRLVSAQAVDVAAFANDAEIVVPYAATIANPAVKIFVLDGMGTMVPMDVPVVITDTIQ